MGCADRGGARVRERVIEMDALDLFRIEGGFIIGGVEYDAGVSPYECGLGWSVALDKQRFRGRDALARDRDSVREHLVSIRLERGGAAASGAQLSTSGGRARRLRDAGDQLAVPERRRARPGEGRPRPRGRRAGRTCWPRSTVQRSARRSCRTRFTIRSDGGRRTSEDNGSPDARTGAAGAIDVNQPSRRRRHTRTPPERATADASAGWSP